MSKVHEVDVCVVGGGPAGMIFGLLLAKQGIRTLVLEKNKDFAREYRGEVLMPRFTQMYRQIGLGEWLEKLPQLKLKYGELCFRDKQVGKIDFASLNPDIPYALWMPQTQLLNALHEKAKPFPSFEIWFGAAVKNLVKSQEGITGVQVNHEGQEIEVKARVTVGADGRFSTCLKEGPFEMEYEDYKFDILWFSIPKPPHYENTFKVLLSPKRSVLLLPKFPDSIQAGILVAPHELAALKTEGIAAVKEELKKLTPLFESFASEMKDFTVFHPLQAHLHFVKEWATDGCLLIGDAAHCCSPAGAIGVSIATGTAIVAADVIAKALKTERGLLNKTVLSQVQRLRESDVRMVHSIQKRVTGGSFSIVLPIRWVLPLFVTLIARTPFFRRFQRKLMTLTEPVPIAKDLGF